MSTKKKSSKKQPVVVNRKFLLDLANDIYDPKTRRFLRLCNGELQNGPDPMDEERPMHCGLGELYFAMTGNQPKEDGVNEEAVVLLAVELSGMERVKEAELKRGRAMIEGLLNVSQDLKDRFKKVLKNDVEERFEDMENDFRFELDKIPDVNDTGCRDDGSCSYDTYRSRAAKVAKQLRKAAAFLPE